MKLFLFALVFAAESLNVIDANFLQFVGNFSKFDTFKQSLKRSIDLRDLLEDRSIEQKKIAIFFPIDRAKKDRDRDREKKIH